MKIKLTYDEETCLITDDKGNVVAEWNDWAICDYPEDLTWARDISKLVTNAYLSGMKRQKQENK
jgi:hypothetical protein